jgi:hypothetical protein
MPQVSSAVRALYAEYRRQPASAFVHLLRRTRSQQIRGLLAHPDRVDLDVFGREVWRFGPPLLFRNQSFRYYEDYAEQSPEFLTALAQEIESGRIELHGNYMFGQATHTFDAQGTVRRGLQEQTENLHRAIRILNEASDPVTKARQLVREIVGLGASNSTALVLMFHPDHYPVCNQRSGGTLYRLGWMDAKPPRNIPLTYMEHFKLAACELKQQLDAQDFLELDAFFDWVYCKQAYPPVPDDDLDAAGEDLLFPEGRKVLRTHQAHERNRALVAGAKSSFRQRYGRLYCQVCEFDFSAAYGELGDGYIEAHHTVPVSELEETSLSRIEDIAMVCSNCHRMLHRKRPWLGTEQLREVLASVATTSANG